VGEPLFVEGGRFLDLAIGALKPCTHVFFLFRQFLKQLSQIFYTVEDNRKMKKMQWTKEGLRSFLGNTTGHIFFGEQQLTRLSVNPAKAAMIAHTHFLKGLFFYFAMVIAITSSEA
jgi:hypothetical protein